MFVWIFRIIAIFIFSIYVMLPIVVITDIIIKIKNKKNYDLDNFIINLFQLAIALLPIIYLIYSLIGA